MEKCVVLSKALWNIQLFHSHNQEDVLEFDIVHFKNQDNQENGKERHPSLNCLLRFSAFYTLAGL